MKMRNMKQVKERVKDIGMKRLFRRNQIIITTLAVMIAAAGYLNYAGKRELDSGNRVLQAGRMEISDEDILAENRAASLAGQLGLLEIPSLDSEPEGNGQLAQAGGVEEATMSAQWEAAVGTEGGSFQTEGTQTESAQTGLENPGEAVLASGMSVADYIANVQLSREQVRARNKETLMSLINSTSIDEAAKLQAIQDMLQLTQISEKENAAETLLMAKGFADPVVSITNEKVDVVVNASVISDPERAQIEDIVKRKAEVNADQIIITLLKVED